MWLESSLSPDDDELGESCILWLYSYLSHADVVLSRRVLSGATGNGRDIGVIEKHQRQGLLVA